MGNLVVPQPVLVVRIFWYRRGMFKKWQWQRGWWQKTCRSYRYCPNGTGNTMV